MIGIVLCCLAFIATLLATRRSLGAGLLVAALFGYLYGILRANILSPASHFIFDGSLVGLYVAFGSKFFDRDRRISELRLWTVILIAWPCLLCLLPFQPFMVSLVGLRGNIFFLPALLVGARLRHDDVRKLSIGLAVLNLGALVIGVMEYFKGLEMFFPYSPVTAIMYSSADVAGGHHRIPSVFSSAHAYAGSMCCTIPFLFGAWVQKDESKFRKLLLLCGMMAALGGVLMASTRLFFVVALYFVTIAMLSSNISPRLRILWMMMIVLMGTLALTNERFQRFKMLSDSEGVKDRIAGSVNRSFLETLQEYPMGNGLGGGGTSMPYFLEGEVRHPISLEIEYGRILAEQGIIGLILWIAFILWCMLRRTAFIAHPWLPTRRLIWFWALIWFINAMIGTGVLTAIPITLFFIMALGWSVVEPAVEDRAPVTDRSRGGARGIQPVPSWRVAGQQRFDF